MEPEQVAGSSKQGLQAVLWRMRAELERLTAEAGPGRMDLPGAMGEWTLKDAIAHLTAWRWWSVARMEAAVQGGGEAPVPPWGDDLSEEDEAGVDQINQQFFERDRAKPVAQVLRESRETLDRLEATLLALSDEQIFEVDRYPWLEGYALADVVLGSAGHLFQEHGLPINLFLARTG